jgi:vacuolar-type H+-ATPase subunit H
MDIMALIDRLEAQVNEGWRIPFTNKTGVDEDAFFETIDQMRLAVPQELEQARSLVEDRERTLAAAHEEAERLLEQARAEAATLVDRGEIMEQARVQAEELAAKYRQEGEEIRRGADDYAMGVLTELESRITALLRTTSNGLVALKRRRHSPEAEEEPPTS